MGVVGSAETAISEDPVDIRLRNAFAPILDPIVDAIYRRPATADLSAAAIGLGSPLVSAPTCHQTLYHQHGATTGANRKAL